MVPNLPEELLVHIFSHFAASKTSRHYLDAHPWHAPRAVQGQRAERTHALRMLCLTSKSFCRLARPLLYGVCPSIDRKNLGLFCETLITTAPRNADLVQALRFFHRPQYHPHPRTRSMRDPRSSEAFPGLANLLQERNLSRSLRSWLTVGLNEDQDDAKIALILLACRNLISLTLASRCMATSDIIPKMLKEACVQNSLCIPEITFHMDDSDLNSPAWDGEEHEKRGLGRYLWYLPFVESMRATGIVMHQDLGLFSFKNFHTPALRRICLEDSVIDEVGVLHILQSFPNLTRLRIHYGTLRLVDLFDPDYGSIGNVFRTDGRLLQELEFDIRIAMCNEFHDFSNGSMFGSLKELRALRILRIPFPLLLGDEKSIGLLSGDAESCHREVATALVDLLPPSLRILELWWWPNDLEPWSALDQLLQPHHFQDLSKIILETHPRYPTQTAPAGWVWKVRTSGAVGVTLKRVY